MEHSGKIEAPDGPHSREAVRDSLLLVAVIRRPGQAAEHNARVRNLSAGGMMADCAARFASGDVVEIAMRGIGEIAGRVAWCTGGRIGIAFDQEIDPLLARKPVNAGGGPDIPHFMKPSRGGRSRLKPQ